MFVDKSERGGRPRLKLLTGERRQGLIFSNHELKGSRLAQQVSASSGLVKVRIWMEAGKVCKKTWVAEFYLLPEKSSNKARVVTQHCRQQAALLVAQDFGKQAGGVWRRLGASIVVATDLHCKKTWVGELLLVAREV